jgi:hypothetical protein
MRYLARGIEELHAWRSVGGHAQDRHCWSGDILYSDSHWCRRSKFILVGNRRSEPQCEADELGGALSCYAVWLSMFCFIDKDAQFR